MGGIRFQHRVTLWTLWTLLAGGVLVGAGFKSIPTVKFSQEVGEPSVTEQQVTLPAPEAMQGGFELVEDQLLFHLGDIRFKMNLKAPYTGELLVDHIPFMGLTTVMAIVFQGEGSPFKGTFRASQVLINYTPVALFHGQYELKENKLVLSNCHVGDSYQVQGSISLTPPYEVELDIGMKELAVSEVFFVSKQAQAGGLSGTAKGELVLSGPITALKATGTVELTEGQLGKKNPIFFSSFFLHLGGQLPLLTITDARLYTDYGVLTAKGDIDLSQLAEGNPLEKIKFYSATKMMRWKGWDIQSIDQDQSNEGEVQVAKHLSQEMRVSFKSFMNDEIEMQKPRNGKNQFELEYRFQKNKRIKMQMRGHEEFLGLENRVKF